MQKNHKKLFGTDGIRGVANQYPMTAEIALSLGRALVHVYKAKESKGKKPRFLIGKDTRLSCYMLEMAMASGICSMGGDVFLTGPMPTPGIAFLTRAMRADAGVVISASPNPFQDNGIKIFCRHGFKLPDDHEVQLERLILSDEIGHIRPTSLQVGKAARVDESKGRYVEFVKSTFPNDLTLEGMKLVIDCANGATYSMAPTIFEELGAEVVAIGVEPNGRNINDGCGAVHPERMAARVREAAADVGLSFDGDGDRLVLADETGKVIDGDAILAVCAEEMIRRGTLKEKTLVATVLSNQAVDDYVEKAGGKVVRCQVGDRYVVEAMRQKGFNFGGEGSGPLVFLDQATTGDGLIASLQILAMMKGRKKPMSKIVSRYHSYPQATENVRVSERKDIKRYPKIQKMIGDCQKTLGKKGRVVVRYAGTEPLVRIMIEGEKADLIKKMAKNLSSCIQKNLT